MMLKNWSVLFRTFPAPRVLSPRTDIMLRESPGDTNTTVSFSSVISRSSIGNHLDTSRRWSSIDVWKVQRHSLHGCSVEELGESCSTATIRHKNPKTSLKIFSHGPDVVGYVKRHYSHVTSSLVPSCRGCTDQGWCSFLQWPGTFLRGFRSCTSITS